MGKSAPSQPAVPSASQTAAAQGQANTSSAASQAVMNFVNQNTPYGATKYDQTGSYTNPQGDTVPTFTQTTSLSPMGQAILGGEQNVSATLIPTAENLAKQTSAATTKPLDFNTPFSSYLSQGPQQLDQKTTDALYQQQKSFLDPQWQDQDQKLQDQLSRQGIAVGSDAYNNAERQLASSRTQAYQSAMNSATGAGSAAASNLFGLAQAGQNQNIQQQQLAATQPLSLLSALYGATPATPTQPIATPGQTAIAPTDVVGAQAAANNAAMAQYQAQVSAQNANTGALSGIAGAGIGAAGMYFF